MKTELNIKVSMSFDLAENLLENKWRYYSNRICHLY
jgi:hypothetical protein